MKPILTVSNLSKDFTKPLDLIAKLLNKVGQDNKEEVVYAIIDKIIGRTGKFIPP